MQRPLTCFAPAKINLSLEVLGRRPDGFHELVSVMQEVTLCDALAALPAKDISLMCDDDSLVSDANLVVRAADLLRQHARVRAGCAFTLEKRIPVAAGLAGGSSDAAAALLLARALWGVEVGSRDLLAIASALGSDVPFFLTGGTAWVEGRGDRVTALPAPEPSWYVLANPGFPVSTARVFAALRPSSWTSGSCTRAVATAVAERRQVTIGTNALQPVLFELYPEAQQCYERAAALASGRTIVSGSGPTVLSLFDSPNEAHASAATLADLGYWTAVVRPKPHKKPRSQ